MQRPDRTQLKPADHSHRRAGSRAGRPRRQPRKRLPTLLARGPVYAKHRAGNPLASRRSADGSEHRLHFSEAFCEILAVENEREGYGLLFWGWQTGNLPKADSRFLTKAQLVATMDNPASYRDSYSSFFSAIFPEKSAPHWNQQAAPSKQPRQQKRVPPCMIGRDPLGDAADNQRRGLIPQGRNGVQNALAVPRPHADSRR